MVVETVEGKGDRPEDFVAAGADKIVQEGPNDVAVDKTGSEIETAGEEDTRDTKEQYIVVMAGLDNLVKSAIATASDIEAMDGPHRFPDDELHLLDEKRKKATIALRDLGIQATEAYERAEKLSRQQL